MYQYHRAKTTTISGEESDNWELYNNSFKSKNNHLFYINHPHPHIYHKNPPQKNVNTAEGRERGYEDSLDGVTVHEVNEKLKE